MILVVWADAMLAGCKHYEQVAVPFEQALERVQESLNGNTVVLIFDLDINTGMGTLCEPYGSVDIYGAYCKNTSIIRWISVSQYGAEKIMTLSSSDIVCAQSEFGFWPTFYASTGFEARKWLFVIWFLAIFVVSGSQLILPLKNF